MCSTALRSPSPQKHVCSTSKAGRPGDSAPAREVGWGRSRDKEAYSAPALPVWSSIARWGNAPFSDSVLESHIDRPQCL